MKRRRDATGRQAYGIRSVQRTMTLLRAFTLQHPQLGLTELAQRLRLHKSTVHRILATLQRDGFVAQDAVSGKYQLGLPLFELGSLVINTMEIRPQARAYLGEIHEACGETVHLAILDEGDVVYIDKIESTRRVRMYSQVGRRAPAHCTGLGKVLLAWLPDPALNQVLERKGLPAFTSRTITSPKELREELAQIRKQGFAIDSGEHEELVRCAAAPVYDHTGQVVAAVSIAAVGVEIDSHRFADLITLVTHGTQQISEAMGRRRDAVLAGG